MEKIIIYDSDHPGAFQNKCFEEEYKNLGSGHSFTVELAKKAKERGFKIMTSDIYLESQHPIPAIAFCITDMISRNTNRLIEKKVIPIICFSFESPIIARDFYIGIQKFAGRFVHNIQFKGTAERLLQTPTQFSVMYFPVDQRVPLPNPCWGNKKLLILVNRNKRMFFSNYGNVKNILRSILSRIKISYQKFIDPWIQSKEIYKDRIEAIHFFSKNEGFHLYGQGWENRIPGFPAAYQTAAKKAFQGSIKQDEKLTVMNGYKFSLCFENCVFPGYVTEKVFDCFLAGTIPIYYGAPDIEEFIPADTFIDYRKFESLTDLENYLVSVTEADAMNMLNAAKSFLSSKDFDKFYTPNVLDDMLDKIESYNIKK